MRARPSVAARVTFALLVAALSAAFAWVLARNTGANYVADFDQIWWAARLVLHGQDPYAVINGSRPGFPFHYFYPMPATWAAIPLAGLDVYAARVTFAAASGAVFAYAVTRERWLPAVAVASQSYWSCVYLVQWTPIIAAAAVLPWLGWTWACKPNVAAIAAVGVRDRRALLVSLAFAAAFAVATLLVDPGWPLRWRDALETAEHFRPIVTRPLGALLLLAVLRWRRAEARVLLALALVPHTPGTREALLFFVTPLNWMQAFALVVGSWGARWAVNGVPWREDFVLAMARSADSFLLWMFLPLLVLTLARPNAGSVPAWLERAVARWPGWIRGHATSLPEAVHVPPTPERW